MPTKFTFEQIQENLKQWFGDSIKPESKQALLVEQTYVKGLRDAGAGIPIVIEMYLQSGRPIVEKIKKNQ
jgi:hypothetical protein